MGDKPLLTVADPEIIKEINIKNFHLFVDRNDLLTGDPMTDRSLFSLMGDDWKKMRSIVSLLYNFCNSDDYNILSDKPYLFEWENAKNASDYC